MRFLICLFLTFGPLYANAQEPETTTAVVETTEVAPPLPENVPTIQPGQEVDWAMSTFQAAKMAADQKAWGPFVSVVLMALLSLFSFVFVRSQELRQRLRPYMGEVALVTGVLGYIGVSVGALGQGAELRDWGGAIWSGVEIGFTAVGAYELLAKRLLKFWLPKLWSLVSKLWAKKEDPA